MYLYMGTGRREHTITWLPGVAVHVVDGSLTGCETVVIAEPAGPPDHATGEPPTMARKTAVPTIADPFRATGADLKAAAAAGNESAIAELARRASKKASA